ncbi:MAG TPA: hypothetical protein VEG08_01535, partial [Terriglobales bacterium]|nr:hypothetical protein [Terriglobales bacterium]
KYVALAVAKQRYEHDAAQLQSILGPGWTVSQEKKDGTDEDLFTAWHEAKNPATGAAFRLDLIVMGKDAASVEIHFTSPKK